MSNEIKTTVTVGMRNGQPTIMADDSDAEISFTPEEWPVIRAEFDRYLGTGDGWNDDMGAAPKDGRKLIGTVDVGESILVGLVYWSDAMMGWATDMRIGRDSQVCAWRPLPSPAPLPEHREASDHE